MPRSLHLGETTSRSGPESVSRTSRDASAGPRARRPPPVSFSKRPASKNVSRENDARFSLRTPMLREAVPVPASARRSAKRRLPAARRMEHEDTGHRCPSPLPSGKTARSAPRLCLPPPRTVPPSGRRLLPAAFCKRRRPPDESCLSALNKRRQIPA